MLTNQRDFLTAAVTAAGVTATNDLVHAQDHSHQAVPSDVALRVKSLESLLVEKGLVDPAALDVLVDVFEHKVGPRWRTGGRAGLGRPCVQATLAQGRHGGRCGTWLFRLANG